MELNMFFEKKWEKQKKSTNCNFQFRNWKMSDGSVIWLSNIRPLQKWDNFVFLTKIHGLNNFSKHEKFKTEFLVATLYCLTWINIILNQSTIFGYLNGSYVLLFQRAVMSNLGSRCLECFVSRMQSYRQSSYLYQSRSYQ